MRNGSGDQDEPEFWRAVIGIARTQSLEKAVVVNPVYYGKSGEWGEDVAQ